MKNKITNKEWKQLLTHQLTSEKSTYELMLELFNIEIPEIKNYNVSSATEHIAEFYVDWDDPLYGN